VFYGGRRLVVSICHAVKLITRLKRTMRLPPTLPTDTHTSTQATHTHTHTDTHRHRHRHIHFHTHTLTLVSQGNFQCAIVTTYWSRANNIRSDGEELHSARLVFSAVSALCVCMHVAVDDSAGYLYICYTPSITGKELFLWLF